MLLKEFVSKLEGRPFKCYRSSKGLIALVNPTPYKKAIMVVE